MSKRLNMLRGICLVPLLVAGVAQAQSADAPVARGLIVQLRADAGSSGLRLDQPQAQRDRLMAVARSAGVAMQSSRVLNNRHQVLNFGQLLRGEALDNAVRRMRLHPDVLVVEPDVRLRPAAVPNDPQYPLRQWNLQTPAQHLTAINMPPAWDLTTGAPVTVAVLDTGIRPAHPELVGKILPGYDFVSEVETANDGDGRDPDPSDPGDWVTAAESRTANFSGCPIENSTWHGTFIAGQIAALTNNADGMAGVSWAARILPVRVSGKCGAFVSDILDAIRWAAGLSVTGVPANPNPARILNLSFGGDAQCSAASQAVLDEVATLGALLVVAAGNESGVLRRPADCQGVLAVSSVRGDGAKAEYSNYGANVALAAPGGSGLQSIYSLTNAGLRGPSLDIFGEKFGTSFSAPLAAGVAALMLSVNPALSGAQLISRMKQGTRPHTFSPLLPACGPGAGQACNCTTTTCGAGLLDADGALRAALRPVAVAVAGGTAQAGNSVQLSGSDSAAATGASVARYDWRQTGGSAVTLIDANAAIARFVVPAAGGPWQFELQVTDSLGRTDTTGLSVAGQALAPADAGTGGGGGGSTGLAWGLGLWLLAALAWRGRRRAVGIKR